MGENAYESSVVLLDGAVVVSTGRDSGASAPDGNSRQPCEHGVCKMSVSFDNVANAAEVTSTQKLMRTTAAMVWGGPIAGNGYWCGCVEGGRSHTRGVAHP
jgi:hypothetical protein